MKRFAILKSAFAVLLNAAFAVTAPAASELPELKGEAWSHGNLYHPGAGVSQGRYGEFAKDYCPGCGKDGPADLDADPVNVRTGALSLSRADGSLSGPFELEFEQGYGSGREFQGATGWGWAGLLDMRLYVQRDSLGVPVGYAFRNRGGMVDSYGVTGAKSAGTLGGDLRILGAADQSGALYVLESGKRTYRFAADGRLLEIVSTGQGRGYRLAYGSPAALPRKGKAATASDTSAMVQALEARPSEIVEIDGSGSVVSGNRLTLTWSAVNGLLSDLGLPDGTHTSYRYDSSGNLVRLEQANGLVRNFRYGSGINMHRMECFNPEGVDSALVVTAAGCPDSSSADFDLWTVNGWSGDRVASQSFRGNRVTLTLNGSSEDNLENGSCVRSNVSLLVDRKFRDYRGKTGSLASTFTYSAYRPVAQNGCNLLRDLGHSGLNMGGSVLPSGWTRQRIEESTGYVDYLNGSYLRNSVFNNYYDINGRLVASQDLSTGDKVLPGQAGPLRIYSRDAYGREVLELELISSPLGKAWWRYTKKEYVSASGLNLDLSREVTGVWDSATGAPMAGTQSRVRDWSYDASNPGLQVSEKACLLPAGQEDCGGSAQLEWSRSYDSQGNLLAEMDADSVLTTYGYAASGSTGMPISTTRGRQKTEYSYDGQGRVLSERKLFLEGGAWSAVSRTDNTYRGGDKVMSCKVDLANSKGSCESYGYRHGRMVGQGKGLAWDGTRPAVSGALDSTEYEYDGLGRKAREYRVLPGGAREFKRGYSYDSRGNVQYEYDSLVYKGSLRERTISLKGIDLFGKVFAEVRGSVSMGYYLGQKSPNLFSVIPSDYKDSADLRRIVYDPWGNMIVSVYADIGQEIPFQLFDSRGNKVLETSPTVNPVYFEFGRNYGFSKFSEYDQFGNLKRDSSASGLVHSYSYDALGNSLGDTVWPSKINAPAVFFVASKAYSGRRVVSSKSYAGRETRYFYNSEGNRTLTVALARHGLAAPAHRVASQDVPSQGELPFAGPVAAGSELNLEILDPEGNSLRSYRGVSLGTSGSEVGFNWSLVARRGFDGFRRQIADTSVNGSVTSMSYDALGRESSRATERGRDTSFFDGNGRLYLRTYRELGSIAEDTLEMYGYDRAGRTAWAWGPGTGLTRHSYDINDRQDTAWDANGNALTTFYDVNHQVSKRPDDVRLEHYGNGVLKSEMKGDVKVSYAYDSEGNVTSRRISFPNSSRIDSVSYYRTWSALASGMNVRVDSAAYPDGSYDVSVYDADGLLLSKDDRRQAGSGAVSYDYDAQGRRVAVRNGRGFPISAFEYDGLGRLSKARTFAGNVQGEPAKTETLLLDYDAKDRPAKVVQAVGTRSDTLGYGRLDSAGLAWLRTPSGRAVIKRTDALGRLTVLSSGADTLLRQEWRGGNKARSTLGNGIVLDYQRAANGADTSAVYSKGGLAIYSLKKALDGRNRAINVRRSKGNALSVIQYTGEEQVRSWKVKDSAGRELNEILHVDYLGNSNEGTAPYFNGEADRMNAYRKDPSGNSIQYDGIGNPTSLGGRTLSWSPEGRLEAVSWSGGSVQYTYDAFGRKVMRVKGTDTTWYAYDGWQLAEETRKFGGTEEVRTYAYGDYVDEPVSVNVSRNGTDARYYYHQGLNYNVEAVTDAQGSLVERYDIELFGKRLNASSIGNELFFQGRPYDADAGLYDFRNRWYSAELQRFVSRDPLRYDAGDANLYRAFGNDPVNQNDPMGLMLENKGPARVESGGLTWPIMPGINLFLDISKTTKEDKCQCSSQKSSNKKYALKLGIGVGVGFGALWNNNGFNFKFNLGEVSQTVYAYENIDCKGEYSGGGCATINLVASANTSFGLPWVMSYGGSGSVGASGTICHVVNKSGSKLKISLCPVLDLSVNSTNKGTSGKKPSIGGGGTENNSWGLPTGACINAEISL